jgi:SAM-dependent methyltransferase
MRPIFVAHESTNMYRIIVIAALSSITALLAGCFNTPVNQAQQPQAPTSMTREHAPVPQPVSDPYHGEGHGYFERLVVDYESKQRAIWQKPDLVISQLGDLKGKTVADIGAGTGYFTFRLVPKADHVIGIDIDERFISFMDSIKVKLPEMYQTRFEARLTSPDQPGLRPGEADAVVIVNTYGYLSNRVSYLRKLSQGMSAGGELLIIDFKKNNLPVGPSEEFKLSVRQVESELREAGFEVEKIDVQSLDYQYIILAKK